MKFLHTILLAGLASGMMFTSCDNIDENDRLLDVEVTQSEKVVLIQEFSGQRCLNCPTGAEKIHSILEANPGKAVAVAMYPFAMDDLTAPYGKEIVRCDLATEYYNHYGRPNTLPRATFDGGATNDNIDTWSAAVMNAFKVTPPASIYLNGTYDKGTRKLTMDTRVDFTQAYSQDCSLILLVTESGIVGPQLMPDGKRNNKYTFNHVLRASFNGTWGQSIGSGFSAQESVSNTISGTIDEAWEAENCSVVAILIRTSDKAVLQAQEWSMSAHE